MASRALLLAMAAMAILWLVHDLQATVIDAHARASARSLLRSPGPNAARVRHALAQFDDAASWNADPAPRLDQARLLLGLGRDQAAAQVLNGVVRRNPGNVVAWSLLATSTAASDPTEAVSAVQRLRTLFGHPPGAGPDKGFLLSSRGLTEVVPGRVVGFLERVIVRGRGVELIGWAGAPAVGQGGRLGLKAPDTILIAAGGKVIATGAPTLRRRDVERSYPGLPAATTGFQLLLPLAQLVSLHSRVRAFAAFGDVGSQLPMTCGTRVQAFACG